MVVILCVIDIRQLWFTPLFLSLSSVWRGGHRHAVSDRISLRSKLCLPAPGAAGRGSGNTLVNVVVCPVQKLPLTLGVYWSGLTREWSRCFWTRPFWRVYVHHVSCYCMISQIETEVHLLKTSILCVPPTGGLWQHGPIYPSTSLPLQWEGVWELLPLLPGPPLATTPTQ